MTRWVRRRWWVVLLSAAAVGGLTVGLSSLQTHTYTAKAVLLVPSGAGDFHPGSAYEAQQLASVYIQLIPRDDTVISTAAANSGLPRSAVVDGLSVARVGDTSLIEVSYSGPSRTTAVLGATAVARSAVAGSVNIPPYSLSVVSFPDRAVVTNGGPTLTGGLLGVLLGLVLGVMLAVWMERSDRRIDRADDLADFGPPVTTLAALTPSVLDLLVSGWAKPHSASTTVGVLSTGDATRPLAAEVASELARRLRRLEQASVGTAPMGEQLRPRTLFVAAAAPGESTKSEELGGMRDLEAWKSDAPVLVVPFATPRVEVAQALDRLRQYGVNVRLLLFSDTGQRKSPRHADERKRGIPAQATTPSEPPRTAVTT